MKTIRVLLLLVTLGALSGSSCEKKTCTCILMGEETTIEIADGETCMDLEPEMGSCYED